MRKWLLLILLFPCLLQAQVLRMTASTNKILIGEQFDVKFEGEVPGNDSSNWLRVDSFDHFEVIRRSPLTVFQSGNAKVFSQTFTLTSWDSGQWLLPRPLPGMFRVKPINVTVSFSDFDPQQPYHDVKDIRDGDLPEQSRWPWYLLLVGVLLILFILFFPRKKQKEETWRPDEGAYKRALRKLDELKASADAQPKLVFTEMINIFRDYLQLRKNIRSHSKTTDDLAVKMSELKLPREEQEALLMTLRMSDLVKFAKYQPERTETAQAIENLKKAITTIERL